MRAQFLSLANVNGLFYPQEALTTVQLTQRDIQWLQLRHNHPVLMATNSREDMQQWTKLTLATMPLDMQKWMLMILNLSEQK
jgi:hypothetical protein